MSTTATLIDAIRNSREVGFASSHAVIEAWICRRPRDHRGHFTLGLLLANHGRYAESVAAYRQSLQCRPNDLKTWINLSNSLVGAGRFAEAEAAAQTALRFDSTNGVAYLNLGNAAARRGNWRKAARAFHNAWRYAADVAVRKQARCNVGMIQLLHGDFKNGWRNFEARDVAGSSDAASRPRAVSWRGESLEGKRLLVRTEQGLGDMIMFARFLPMLIEHGATLIVSAPIRLISLLRWAEGSEAIQFIAYGEPCPDFDLETRMMSVAGHLGVHSTSQIPAPASYFSIPPECIDRWAARLPRRRPMRVGVAWRGSSANAWDMLRSAPREALAPLAELAELDVELVNLQWDGQEEDQLADRRWTVVGKADESGAMLDTAAIIETLDAVVSVDTAVAHLAGALGKPTWLALSSTPDWRWRLTGEQSSWYPSLKLVRQSTAGDWSAVFEKIARELRGP